MKNGHVYNNKKDKRRHEALVANATAMLRNLEPSTRSGLDFTLNDPLKSSLLPCTRHSFQTCLEHVSHDYLAPENVLSSTLRVTPMDLRGRGGQYSEHRLTASLTSGVRFPSLPLEEVRLNDELRSMIFDA